MDLEYKKFEEKDLDMLIKFYMDYYNSQGGTWTDDIARKRIHQIATMEDSLVVLQFDKERLSGFLMGYVKYFDDSRGFFLEEILISSEFQCRGYGTKLLYYLKEELAKNNCSWIELLTTTSELHQRFYTKNGYRLSGKLVLEHLDL